MLVVVAYDVANDRRRVRLHTVLSKYGTPVQESVFECELDAGALRRLRMEISAVTHRRFDRIRIYPLCERCQQRRSDGHQEIPPETPSVIVL